MSRTSERKGVGRIWLQTHICWHEVPPDPSLGLVTFRHHLVNPTAAGVEPLLGILVLLRCASLGLFWVSEEDMLSQVTPVDALNWL